jgi:hypothetical protein
MSRPELPEFRTNQPEKEALRFCESFDQLLKTFRDLAGGDQGLAKWEQAKGLKESLIHQSYNAHLPFELQVIVPEGVRSDRSSGYTVLEENVRQFIATDFRDMDFGKDGFQVDFYNLHNNFWLTVYESYDIRLTPAMPQNT